MHLVEVDQFVDDDVFGDLTEQQHCFPVEIELGTFAAGAPAVAGILNF